MTLPALEFREIRWRTITKIAGKAGPSLVVAWVVPSVCFLLGEHLWGLWGAVVVTISWNLLCQGVRLLRGSPLSCLLVIGLVELSIRATTALSMNSARMYFVAPVIVTMASGALLISFGLRSFPLASRLAGELIPTSLLGSADQNIEGLTRQIFVLYGAEQMLTASVSFVMLSSVSVATYAAFHPIVSSAVFAIWALPSLFWLARRPGAAARADAASLL